MEIAHFFPLDVRLAAVFGSLIAADDFRTRGLRVLALG
jgi:hypothetical protein